MDAALIGGFSGEQNAIQFDGHAVSSSVRREKRTYVDWTVRDTKDVDGDHWSAVTDRGRVKVPFFVGRARYVNVACAPIQPAHIPIPCVSRILPVGRGRHPL